MTSEQSIGIADAAKIAPRGPEELSVLNATIPADLELLERLGDSGTTPERLAGWLLAGQDDE